MKENTKAFKAINLNKHAEQLKALEERLR